MVLLGQNGDRVEHRALVETGKQVGWQGGALDQVRCVVVMAHPLHPVYLDAGSQPQTIALLSVRRRAGDLGRLDLPANERAFQIAEPGEALRKLAGPRVSHE